MSCFDRRNEVGLLELIVSEEQELITYVVLQFMIKHVVGCQKDHIGQSSLKVVDNSLLVLRKFFILSDVASAKCSKINPQLPSNRIKCSYTPTPFLTRGLLSGLANPVRKVMLNSNSIFNNNIMVQFRKLHKWKLQALRSLTFFLSRDCPGTKAIRDSSFFQINYE